MCPLLVWLLPVTGGDKVVQLGLSLSLSVYPGHVPLAFPLSEFCSGTQAQLSV